MRIDHVSSPSVRVFLRGSQESDNLNNVFCVRSLMVKKSGETVFGCHYSFCMFAEHNSSGDRNDLLVHNDFITVQ